MLQASPPSTVRPRTHSHSRAKPQLTRNIFTLLIKHKAVPLDLASCLRSTSSTSGWCSPHLSVPPTNHEHTHTLYMCVCREKINSPCAAHACMHACIGGGRPQQTNATNQPTNPTNRGTKPRWPGNHVGRPEGSHGRKRVHHLYCTCHHRCDIRASTVTVPPQ